MSSHDERVTMMHAHTDDVIPSAHLENGGERVTVDDLSRWRREMLRLLDQLDGRQSPQLGPGARVSRLREARLVPRTIAAWMKAILEMRNAAEYEGLAPSEAESEAVRKARTAVLHWAIQQRLVL
jgi:PHD/YefM family antitoxin component YafN of YafNO toxin-antitoxin module